ncbi:MAG: asparagine synthase B [Betaproteobacteria bacterium]|jgi:asparagine synthase (glutamine-hydrolysing)|nr:MAG: asparagine synthase B [Betaproteobacteria bacterium]
MCGIAGIWGSIDDGTLTNMISLQHHRGPDGRGTFVSPGHGALGHTRLAIMDPSGGAQPIHNEDNSATVVANGMIYNHPQLRRRLGQAHDFTSGTDSETILHLFEEQGLATPRLLDGMFAFAIATGKRLFLARDYIGIKPLYYARPENSDEPMYFASELKALAPLGMRVQEFPPGTCYDSETGFHTYYVVPDRPAMDLAFTQHVRRVREAVEAAVQKRLLSDVPLGAFLSGGLDSSIIAAIAAQHMPKLHTFSVGIEGSRDLEAARCVSRHIGSTHHEYVYSANEVVEALPEIVYYLESFDKDLVRSAIPTWFCARLASQEVKVILTGEGADELFAGYRYHKDIADPQVLRTELRRSITRMHNINLQRVDRMTMRHGIEARVPFLDRNVIELGSTVPTEYKLRDIGGVPVEKWILRKAFEDLLPSKIVWRDKEQFDEGSGMVDLLPQLIGAATDSIDVPHYQACNATDRLRSAEECWYHQLLVDAFDDVQPVLANVGRWRLN